MKKILKIIVPLLLLLLFAAAYIFVPGVQSWPQQNFAQSGNGTGAFSALGRTESLYLRQVITADSTVSRTIAWHSEETAAGAMVELRLKGTEELQTVPAVSEKFTDDKITHYLHKVTLTGLKPAAKYEYRIGYGRKRSPWFDLTTAGEGAFKALIFPDSQSNDYRNWEKLAQTAGKTHPDAAFFVNMGDLVDNGEEHSQWRAWFGALHGIIDRIPIAPLLGNHETYDLNWKVRMPVAYLKYFELPPNGSAERRNQFYSFDHGNVHFVVLNTQLAEMEQLQPGLLAAQKEWLQKDLAGTKKKWKVALMHKDVLQYSFKHKAGRKPGISDLGKAFMPLFDEYGIDLVLSAHLHTYRNRGKIYDFKPDERGPVYIVTGVAGNVRYPDLWQRHPFDLTLAPQPETDNYLTLEASEDRLLVQAFLPNGTQFDRVEITK